MVESVIAGFAVLAIKPGACLCLSEVPLCPTVETLMSPAHVGRANVEEIFDKFNAERGQMGHLFFLNVSVLN